MYLELERKLLFLIYNRVSKEKLLWKYGYRDLGRGSM